MVRLSIAIMLLAVPLAGCSFGAPPAASSASTSQAADLDACTHQADQINEARNYAYISRTDQMSTPRSGLPDQQYVTNRLAELHVRDQRIKQCMQNGNQANPSLRSDLPEPQIIGPTS